jgi:hypothetical protein
LGYQLASPIVQLIRLDYITTTSLGGSPLECLYNLEGTGVGVVIIMDP